MNDDFPHEAVQTLLASAGLPVSGMRVVRLTGGKNNQAYRLDLPNQTVMVKRYFRGGDWDRLAAESRFLRFCEQAGVPRVPRLLAEDPRNGIAAHSWMDGEGFSPGIVGPADVAEAAAFLGDLGRASRERPDDAPAPARDACLSLEDFFRSPRERLADLKRELSRQTGTPVARDAMRFLDDELVPLWDKAAGSVSRLFAETELRAATPRNDLLFSPSDFGFHNALRLRGGEGIGFVDFEYSGLDDPTKVIGDFVFQPSFPAPRSAIESLAAAARGDAGRGERLAARVRALAPLFRVKFCCIILNDFKSIDDARRGFALREDAIERRERQLRKARSYASLAE